MAERPVFIPKSQGNLLVETKLVSFQWHAGMSASQKKKSIVSLHESAKEQLGLKNILEISTKSEDLLGQSLSAFNLMYTSPKTGSQYPLESIFQASKVFEKGGPYADIRGMSPRDAKQDPRLKESGRLVSFTSAGETWPLEPLTAFYDWLYLNVLVSQSGLTSQLKQFQGFTDIEFNPKKSINCQAYSVALYVALDARGLLSSALSSKDEFISCIRLFDQGVTVEDTPVMGNLF